MKRATPKKAPRKEVPKGILTGKPTVSDLKEAGILSEREAELILRENNVLGLEKMMRAASHKYSQGEEMIRRAKIAGFIGIMMTAIGLTVATVYPLLINWR